MPSGHWWSILRTFTMLWIVAGVDNCLVPMEQTLLSLGHNTGAFPYPFTLGLFILIYTHGFPSSASPGAQTLHRQPSREPRRPPRSRSWLWSNMYYTTAVWILFVSGRACAGPIGCSIYGRAGAEIAPICIYSRILYVSNWQWDRHVIYCRYLTRFTLSTSIDGQRPTLLELRNSTSMLGLVTYK